MNQWIFRGTTAEWAGNSVTLAWDPAKPDMGLNVRIPSSVTQCTFNLFGVSLAGATPTSHLTACGAALRATFPESERLPVETQITWNVLDLGTAVLGLDAVVSVSTQEVDGHPQIGLCSRIADAVALEPTSSDRTTGKRNFYTLCRPHGSDLTYVEMVHPTDSHSDRFWQDDETGCVLLRHTLFARPLEKGVILRARLRGLLLRRGGDEQAAAACYAQFCDALPPLGR